MDELFEVEWREMEWQERPQEKGQVLLAKFALISVLLTGSCPQHFCGTALMLGVRAEFAPLLLPSMNVCC